MVNKGKTFQGGRRNIFGMRRQSEAATALWIAVAVQVNVGMGRRRSPNCPGEFGQSPKKAPRRGAIFIEASSSLEPELL
jgi:hypothetical protein